MKLELGAGQRPTPGYISTDSYPHPGLDHVCNAWEIPDGPYDEVIALGVIEHLTMTDAFATFDRIHEVLQPGGTFLFDVPDFVQWARYLEHGTDLFEIDHVMATLHGWCRWPGDEHKSSWTPELIEFAMARWNYVEVSAEPAKFLTRGLIRNRMTRPGDAHLYVVATK